MAIEISLSFGALSPPFHEQLSAQGWEVKSADALARLQQRCDEATNLFVLGYIPESVVLKVRKRLMREVAALRMAPRAAAEIGRTL